MMDVGQDQGGRHAWASETPLPRASPKCRRGPCYDDTTMRRSKQIEGFKDDPCKDWTVRLSPVPARLRGSSR